LANLNLNEQNAKILARETNACVAKKDCVSHRGHN